MVTINRYIEHQHGQFVGPDFGHDARGYFYRQFDGTHLFLRLYEGRTWIPALLCIPFALYHDQVGLGRSNQHLPDVCFQGIARC